MTWLKKEKRNPTKKVIKPAVLIITSHHILTSSSGLSFLVDGRCDGLDGWMIGFCSRWLIDRLVPCLLTSPHLTPLLRPRVALHPPPPLLASRSKRVPNYKTWPGKESAKKRKRKRNGVKLAGFFFFSITIYAVPIYFFYPIVSLPCPGLVLLVASSSSSSSHHHQSSTIIITTNKPIPNSFIFFILHHHLHHHHFVVVVYPSSPPRRFFASFRRSRARSNLLDVMSSPR